MKDRLSRFKKEVSYFERRLPGLRGIRLNVIDSKTVNDLRDRLLKIAEQLQLLVLVEESEFIKNEHGRGGCNMNQHKSCPTKDKNQGLAAEMIIPDPYSIRLNEVRQGRTR